jgi:hypothetical protein
LLVVDAVLMFAMLVPMPFPKIEQCGVFDLTQVAQAGDPYAPMKSYCFEQAFFSCQSATLTYVNNATQLRIITVEKHFIGCNITDTIQYIDESMKNVTYLCSGVRISRWGLLIEGCGDDYAIFLSGRVRLRGLAH